MNKILKNKQLLSIFLLLVYLINGLSSVVVFAENVPKSDNKDFVVEDGQLVRYKGPGGDIVLPDGIEIIKEGVFRDKKIRSIKLPNSLIEIEDFAFSVNNIEEVIIPAKVEKIGAFAFSDNNISKVLFNKNDIELGKGVFADNSLEAVNLENISNIPEQAFINNKIELLKLSSNLANIDDMAFAINKLDGVVINSNNSDIMIADNAFIYNGQMVGIKTSNENITNSNVRKNGFGHIVNPINIKIKYLKEIGGNKYVKLMDTKQIEFNPIDTRTIFSLNKESYYLPEAIYNHELVNKNITEDGYIKFTPDKNDYELIVVYKELPGPKILFDDQKVEEFQKNKIEGDSISREDLLELVRVTSREGEDISNKVVISPSKIDKIENKLYTIEYSVEDKGQVYNISKSFTFTPNPLLAKIGNTEWIYGDFIYNDVGVAGFSDSGKVKLSDTNIKTIGIPGINPLTKTPIRELHLAEGDVGSKVSLLKDLSHITNAEFSNPEHLALIGERSFEGSSIRSLPSFPNLEFIEDYAFNKAAIGGEISIPNINFIGENGLHFLRNENHPTIIVDKVWDNITYIGGAALNAIYLGKHEDNEKLLPEMPNLTQMDDSGIGFHSEYVGKFPIFESLIVVPASIIREAKDVDMRDSFPNAERISRYAFQRNKLSVGYPKMRKVKWIGGNAFDGISGTTRPFLAPELESLEISEASAFFAAFTDIRDIGYLQNLKEWNLQSVPINAFTLPLKYPEEFASLEVIGLQAWNSSFIKLGLGEFVPKLPKIKEFKSSAMENTPMKGVFGERGFGDWPELEIIGTKSLSSKNFSGKLPYWPKLREIGYDAFTNTKIDKSHEFIVNSDIKIHKDAFRNIEPVNVPLVIRTVDGKAAPNIEPSPYHVLNPQNITYVALDEDGNEIMRKKIMASEVPEGLRVFYENVVGYKVNDLNSYIDVDKSKLVNNTIYVNYNKKPEGIKEDNEYHLSINSDTSSLNVDELATFDIAFKTMKDFKHNNRNHVIVIEYNPDVVSEISSAKGVELKVLAPGKATISKVVKENSNYTFPINYKVKNGFIKDTYAEFDIYLSQPEGYESLGQSLKRPINYSKPFYQSIFTKDKVKSEISSRLVQNINDYEVNIKTSLQPEIKSAVRDFNKISVKYKAVEYDSLKGFKIASISDASKANGWKYDSINKEYVYEKIDNLFFDIEKMPIPALELEFDSPKTQSLLIESYTDLDVNTSIENEKNIKLFDKNYLDIKIEERSGNIITSNIDTPRNQKGSRFSYFYEGNIDRGKSFKWEMKYYFPKKFDRFEVDIDFPDNHHMSSLEVKGVNPNKVIGEILFLDHEGNTMKKEDLRGLKQYNPNYYIYNNIKVIINDESLLENEFIEIHNDTAFNFDFTPIYKEGKEKDNIYTQHYKTAGILEGKEPFIVTDSTHSEMRKANRTIFANVRDFSESENIIQGDGGTIMYGIGSYDYIKSNISELEYDILIDSSHTVESVNNLISKNGYFSYDIFENYNNSGKTLIKTKFKDLNLEIEDIPGYESAVKPIIAINLSNNDLSSTKLETYAMIKESDHYDIYYQGNGMIEDIDLSKYSVDRKEANISIPEYFHINKRIKHNNYEKQEVVTKANEKFSYTFNIYNKEKVQKENFILVDVLPFDGDFNESNNTNLLDLDKIKNIQLPDGFKIEYFDTDISTINKDTLIKDYKNKAGSSTPTKNTTVVKITADNIGNNYKTSIEIPMITSPAQDEELITINKFAFHHSELDYDQGFSNEVTQRINALPKLRDVEFKKVASENGEITGPLEGVEFILIDKNSNILGSAISGKDGLVKFENIDINKIDKVVETKTPVGYEKVSPITVKNMKFNEVDGVYVGKDIINNKIDYSSILIKAVEVDSVNDLDYKNIKEESNDILNNSLLSISLKLTNLETNEERTLSLPNVNKYLTTTYPKYGKYKLDFVKYTGKENIEHMYEKNLNSYYIKIDESGIYYSYDEQFKDSELLLLEENIVYFPIERLSNTPNGDFVKIVKVDKDGNRLPGAVFEVVIDYNNPSNAHPNGKIIYEATTDQNGEAFVVKEGDFINSIKVKEVKAPNGYFITNSEYISLPSSERINYLEVKNERLRLLVNKYKIIANNVSYEEALELQDSFETTDNGRVHIELNQGGLYTVKEVWEDNEIKTISGNNEAITHTDTKGVARDIENDLGFIDIDEDLIIKDETDITSHYRAATKIINPQDYMKREDFNGTIEIDLEILPRFGSVYVSKYVLSKLNKPTKGEAVNGTKFALLEEKDGQFVSIEEKTIDNGSFVIFDNLKPEKNYKVEEIEASEGYNISEDNIRDVVINSNNSYIDRLIFRNYADAEVGSLNIKKIDGRTGKSIEGVEFTIFNSDGEVIESRYTNKDGEIEFLDLLVDQADFTIKETKAAPGYRLATEEIVATLDDILEGKTFTVKNYKYNETPKTGTSGKLPFFLISIPLIILAYVFNKKKY